MRLRGVLSLALVILVEALLVVPTCRGENPTPTSPIPSTGPRILPISGPVSNVAGRLLLTEPGALSTFELGTKAHTALVRFPDGTPPGSPAVSPDGARIAYSLYRTNPDGKSPGGTDLYVMAVDATGTELVVDHEQPGASITDPAWAANGQNVYFTYRNLDGVERIERVQLGAPERTLIVERAHSPTLSANGKQLAYLAIDEQARTDTLWVSTVDGTEAQPLVGGPTFRALSLPRFAPDSNWIVFAAVGGPQSTTFVRPLPRARLPPLRFPSSIASAHGVPWDLWLIRSDGTGLRRLTNIGEHAPIPAWSPDGRWIAFTGELGVYLVDVEGGTLLRLTEALTGSGVTWLRSNNYGR